MSGQKIRKGIVMSKDGQIMIVREDETQTQYIVFMDELNHFQKKELTIHAHVEFTRDGDYEQFVVDTISLAKPSQRKVV